MLSMSIETNTPNARQIDKATAEVLGSVVGILAREAPKYEPKQFIPGFELTRKDGSTVGPTPKAPVISPNERVLRGEPDQPRPAFADDTDEVFTPGLVHKVPSAPVLFSDDNEVFTPGSEAQPKIAPLSEVTEEALRAAVAEATQPVQR